MISGWEFGSFFSDPPITSNRVPKRTKQSCFRVASHVLLIAGLLIVTGSAHAQWSVGDLNPFILADNSISHSGAGTQVVGYAITNSDLQRHAALWSGPGYAFLDLNPTGATSSEALGAIGSQQAGNATFGTSTHAGLWNGTAASWVDLNPSGAASSTLVGFAGTQQVGSAEFGSAIHAGRWNDTAASWVDLNPPSATGSVAYATTGARQVGSATFASSTHAGLWDGTAASWVDLNPTNAIESAAKFIDPNVPGQQVGYAKFGSNNHAGLWHTTAASWVDLNPASATSSQVNGISSSTPGQQVGQATIGGAIHAGFWNGTAASWVDLNPAGATESVAYGISGNTQAGYAKYSDGSYWAGTWSGTAASWQALPFPENNDETTYTAWYLNACTSIWTDGIRLYASGHLSRAGYVSTLHNDHAVVWSRLAPCSLLGDINLDGLRNGADVQGFLNCLLGAGGNCSCADTDGNGAVNSADVAALVTALMS